MNNPTAEAIAQAFSTIKDGDYFPSATGPFIREVMSLAFEIDASRAEQAGGDGYVTFSSSGIHVDLNRFLATDAGKETVRRACATKSDRAQGVQLKANGGDAQQCATCNGTGWLGGPSFYEPGEGGVQCPDCDNLETLIAAQHPQRPDGGEWIPWAGDQNSPVPSGTTIRYRRRKMSGDFTAPAEYVRWIHLGQDSDIVAYQVVANTVPPSREVGDATWWPDDSAYTAEELAQWLDKKYARHKEDEDRQAAAMLRKLSVAPRQVVGNGAVTHFRKYWIPQLKKYSDNGIHPRIPSNASAGLLYELAVEIEQLIASLEQPAPGAVDALTRAGNCLLSAMKMQEGRDSGDLHINQETAIHIWNEAKAAWKAALTPDAIRPGG